MELTKKEREKLVEFAALSYDSEQSSLTLKEYTDRCINDYIECSLAEDSADLTEDDLLLIQEIDALMENPTAEAVVPEDVMYGSLKLCDAIHEEKDRGNYIQYNHVMNMVEISNSHKKVSVPLRVIAQFISDMATRATYESLEKQF